jgi:hypothetical protein
MVLRLEFENLILWLSLRPRSPAASQLIRGQETSLGKYYSWNGSLGHDDHWGGCKFVPLRHRITTYAHYVFVRVVFSFRMVCCHIEPTLQQGAIRELRAPDGATELNPIQRIQYLIVARWTTVTVMRLFDSLSPVYSAAASP